jgi:hypothetical protein
MCGGGPPESVGKIAGSGGVAEFGERLETLVSGVTAGPDTGRSGRSGMGVIGDRISAMTAA